MLERLAFGELPRKHHIALRGAGGGLRYEECLTRSGFDGAYTIAYHEHRPQALRAIGDAVHEAPAGDAAATGLARRHYQTRALPKGTEPSQSRGVLLRNADVSIGALLPTQSDAAYSLNAGADELLFVLEGQGTVRSVLGDLAFAAGDYVFLPKGVVYRLLLDAGAGAHLLSLECFGGLDIPRRFRNPVGQLRMDAPYSHRDFRRPVFRGPLDEGLREVWVRDSNRRQKFVFPQNPLDVVGWDGTLYPWAFPILNFQPRVSSVHLPPTWHGTFAARGALICSFVPRPLDFHPEAVPCPYTHTSADMDEVLFYVAGDFSSRVGVQSGSLTLHPGGVPHGPHPGRYEDSVGAKRTDEIAVMLDVTSRLSATPLAQQIEAPEYDQSFDSAARVE